MRHLEFEPDAFAEFAWWIKQNRKVALRIVKLLNDVQRDPFDGIGKPEPLKHNLSGAWSRRIDKEHRLVYIVTEETIRIVSC